MTIKIVKSTNWDSAHAVHLMSMCGADFEQGEDMHLWLAWEGDQPVGFASVEEFQEEGLTYSYFAGCGVIPHFRGQGIQKRLIRARLAWGTRRGHNKALSYTMHWNAKSINSLIKCGFKSYEPLEAYAGEELIYWFKSLTKSS